jgi:hypothetical protein
MNAGSQPDPVPNTAAPAGASTPAQLPDPETIIDAELSVPPGAAFAPHAAGLASPAFLGDLALAKDEQDTYEQSKHKQILAFRRWLVPGVFALTIGWLAFVCASIAIEQHRHPLSDAVLIAMLGAATANVLGLLVIVLKSLFPIEADRYEQ